MPIQEIGCFLCHQKLGEREAGSGFTTHTFCDDCGPKWLRSQGFTESEIKSILAETLVPVPAG